MFWYGSHVLNLGEKFSFLNFVIITGTEISLCFHDLKLHRKTMPPPLGSSWLHCNQGGLVNSLMPLNLYGLSLLKRDSFVQVWPQPLLPVLLLHLDHDTQF